MEIKEKLVCAAKNANNYKNASSSDIFGLKNGIYYFWVQKSSVSKKAYYNQSFLEKLSSTSPKSTYVTETSYKISSLNFGESEITEQEYNELLDVYNKLKDKKDKENIKKLEELCK